MVDVVSPGFPVEGHAGKLGDKMGVDGPEQKDDDVARALGDGALQIVQHGGHDGWTEGVEKIDNEIVVREDEVGRVGVYGFEIRAAAAGVMEALDVSFSFVVEIG